MTRFPVEEKSQVVGLRGDEYGDFDVGPSCARPGCTRLKDHAHHVCSRGQMGGGFYWVKMPDGTEIGNLVPVCFQDHEDITNNKARIIYDKGKFYWVDAAGEILPLSWQPPSRSTSGQVHESRMHAPQVHTHGDPDGRVCQTCGRALPKPKEETDTPEEKRLRATWAISVPKDEREDGADTLDALLEAARDELAAVGMYYSEDKKAKFFVLSSVLALFVQHAHQMLSDS